VVSLGLKTIKVNLLSRRNVDLGVTFDGVHEATERETMVDLAHSLILEHLSIRTLSHLLQLHEDDLAGASSYEDSSLKLSDLPNVIDAFAVNIE